MSHHYPVVPATMRTPLLNGPVPIMTDEELKPKKARRTPSESLYENKIASKVDLPDTFTDDNDDRISAIHDPRCRLVGDHLIGEYCHECRTIMMPWFDMLPQPLDENGEYYLKAPPGSIVRGVPLQDPEAIAVMTIVASFDIVNAPYDDVDRFVEIMTFYDKSVTAGLLIAELYRMIARMSTPEHDIPSIADIVESALEDPALAPEVYIQNTWLELEKFHPLRPAFGQAKFWISTDSSEDAPRINRELDFDDSRRPGVAGKLSYANLIEKGPWEFVSGTDTSKVVLGVLEPHKFVLVCQEINRPDTKDVRRFPSRSTMDWNEPADILRLNKWRYKVKGSLRQVKKLPNQESQAKRESHAVKIPPQLTQAERESQAAKLSPQWTQTEKNFLKSAVEAELAIGKDQFSIDWDGIAKAMFDHFQNKIEDAGQPLARPTDLLDDNTIAAPQTKLRKLSKPRVGALRRTGLAISSQARKYGDIALLLRLSVHVHMRAVSDHDQAIEDVTDNGDEGQGGKKAEPKKGQKRRREESPEAGSKSPPEQFEEQVNKNLNDCHKSKTNVPAPQLSEDSAGKWHTMDDRPDPPEDSGGKKSKNPANDYRSYISSFWIGDKSHND